MSGSGVYVHASVCVFDSLYIKCLSSLLFHYPITAYVYFLGHIDHLMSGNRVYVHARVCVYVFVCKMFK